MSRHILALDVADPHDPIMGRSAVQLTGDSAILHDLYQSGRGRMAAGLGELRRCQSLEPHLLSG